MSDYIKRETAMHAVWGCARATGIHDAPFEYASGIIKDLPSADVAPVRHGKYIGTEFDGYADGCPVYYEWKCSECGCVFEEEEPTYNYCPNCGARMDGDDDEID